MVNFKMDWESFMDFSTDDTETEVNVILEFVDDDISVEEADRRASAALEQFEFDDLLDINEIGIEEVVSYLFETGYIGLPRVLDDEEVEDNEAPF